MLRRYTPTVAALGGVVLLVVVLAVVGRAWWASRIPDTYSVMDYGTHDNGGGVSLDHDGHGAHGTISVADLHGPEGEPDARFVLSARAADVRLASGRVVHALTFNGRSPGPELRVREGDLVEVVLRNEDVRDGVTIHWHGVDVPNAEDGVAGVTQDAVLPGESHVYRFRADQVGTFWYHTHQSSSTEVRRGLFGALIIQPGHARAPGLDLAIVVHTFDGIPTLNANDAVTQRAVSPGTPVLLRLVNTDNAAQRLSLRGVPFRVAAIDGTGLHGATLIRDRVLTLAAGGRMDLSFGMPASPVQLSLGDTRATVVLSRDGTAPPRTGESPEVDFDPLTYGTPAPTPFDASSSFDRRFDLTISRKLGFYDGRPGRQWALDGGIYPDVPMFTVGEGDLVEVTITNKTKVVHPMHLHGHHALVLSRDGVASSGSPWWIDTLNVRPGDTYAVAFRADNPGIWMDHCHNLAHAAAGLTMHLAYAGVKTPFLVGGAHHNAPE